jgi:arginase
MGRGPERLLDAGAADRLTSRGARIVVERVKRPGPFRNEVASSLEVASALRTAVGKAIARGEFPLILAGDCNSCLGTLAGLGGSGVAVVWLDAHGDFNTPETSPSGNFDGMALATATGRCWSHAAAQIVGLRSLPEDRVLLVGARALDPLEHALLASSEIALVAPSDLRTAPPDPAPRARGDRLETELRVLATRARGAYLHVDLDVVDAAEAPANEWAARGGLSVAEVERVIACVAAHLPLRAAALTAYDPAGDPAERALAAALRLIEALGRAAASSVEAGAHGVTMRAPPEE